MPALKTKSQKQRIKKYIRRQRTGHSSPTLQAAICVLNIFSLGRLTILWTLQYGTRSHRSGIYLIAALWAEVHASLLLSKAGLSSPPSELVTSCLHKSKLLLNWPSSLPVDYNPPWNLRNAGTFQNLRRRQWEPTKKMYLLGGTETVRKERLTGIINYCQNLGKIKVWSSHWIAVPAGDKLCALLFYRHTTFLDFSLWNFQKSSIIFSHEVSNVVSGLI